MFFIIERLDINGNKTVKLAFFLHSFVIEIESNLINIKIKLTVPRKGRNLPNK